MAKDITGLTWYGDNIKRKVIKACIMGVNRTMAVGVAEAKGNHGGWENRTGTAERSIRIAGPGQVRGDEVVGLWGSVGVAYFWWLEFGSALRSGYDTLRGAASKVHPMLGRMVKQAYGELK